MSNLNYNLLAEQLDYLRRNLSAFIEEVCDIKLNTYQKFIIENISKYNPTPKRQIDRWNNYINLCLAFIRMEDDDNIVIVNPKRWEKLSKLELLEYIENYWK